MKAQTPAGLFAPRYLWEQPEKRATHGNVFSYYKVNTQTYQKKFPLAPREFPLILKSDLF